MKFNINIFHQHKEIFFKNVEFFVVQMMIFQDCLHCESSLQSIPFVKKEKEKQTSKTKI